MEIDFYNLRLNIEMNVALIWLMYIKDMNITFHIR